jgi:hypothetical protein
MLGQAASTPTGSSANGDVSAAGSITFGDQGTGIDNTTVMVTVGVVALAVILIFRK